MCRDALRRRRKRIMLQLCTGAGKTVIAAEIIRMAREKRKRVLFIVDAISLIDQTVQRFEEHGLEDIGVIQGSHWRTNYSKPIQVASVQTLARRSIPDFDFAIVDEAHAQYKAIRDMMDENPEKIFIGLSATPWSKGLGNSYEELLVPVRMQELIDQGYLSPFKVYAPSHPDLSKTKVIAGDYDEDDLARVMGDETLVADVVQTWKNLGQGMPTLCFCVDRAHARLMADRFNEAGVPCGYIDGETPAEERRDIERQLNNGDIQVVSNVGCLTKGVDWAIGCVILARPTKSASLAVQMIGRGLRVNPGIGDCIILDHTDTVLRLGFPTDIHRDEMCTAKKGERQKTELRAATTPAECPSCHALRSNKGAPCACGHVPKDRTSDLREGAGALSLVQGGKQTEATVKRAKPKPSDKLRFYQELLGYCHLHGKTMSYALATFRNRFNEWPHKKDGVQPVNPSPETLSYIRSRNIAFAKSRQANGAR
jgi:superfamily II DNA or RNA helicase